MKKIILSLAMIAMVSTVAVGATQSVFSDEKTSAENTFAAGTLKLDVQGRSTANESYTWENIKPGDSAGWDGVTSPWRPGLSWTVQNTGTIDGILTVSIKNIQDWYWNGSSPSSPLSSLVLTLSGTGDPKLSTQLRPQVRVNGGWKTESSGFNNLNPFTIDLDAGQSATIAIAWGFNVGAGNEYQGAKTKLNVNFNLAQK